MLDAEVVHVHLSCTRMGRNWISPICCGRKNIQNGFRICTTSWL